MFRKTRLIGGIVALAGAVAALSTGCSSSMGGGTGGSGSGSSGSGSGSGGSSGSSSSGSSTSGTGGFSCTSDAQCPQPPPLSAECKTGVCVAGVCALVKTPGSKCYFGNEGGSGFCDSAGACRPEVCVDGIKDMGETDVDCGGEDGLSTPCARCAGGKTCTTASDCESYLCSNLVCQGASCSDGVKNGGEGDVDCGGSCATKCAGGKHCGGPGDCASNVCKQDGTCQ